LVAERIKHLHYSRKWSNYWFWRTREQKEIDYIEESDGVIHAYEFKFNQVAKSKPVKHFFKAYENAVFHVINRDNYDEFLL